MTPQLIKTTLFALALCFGMNASAQDAAAPEAEPAAEAAPAAETTPAVDAAPAAEAAPAATGRIIFFRPKKFAGGAVKFKVREGEDVLGKLGSGTFFAVDVPAGTHSYYAKSEGKDDTLVMEVEPGETYYVMGSIAMGMFAGQGNLAPSDQAAFDEANKKKLKDLTGEKVD